LSIVKTVETAHVPVRLGDLVTYTIVVANNGDSDAAGVVVTDVLPVGVAGDDLFWTGVVTAEEQVEFTIPAVATTSSSFTWKTITNTATSGHAGDSGCDDAALTIGIVWRVYLPIALRSHY
jgi:uncharacterized repeat protein (TIGR01451 family)